MGPITTDPVLSKGSKFAFADGGNPEVVASITISLPAKLGGCGNGLPIAANMLVQSVTSTLA
jgi:hypothetical protein